MDGWVYVLSNESMPGVIKIGHSMKDPKIRAFELYQTGIPTPFIIEFSALVKNPKNVEFAAHRLLAKDRVNPNREFFKCTVWDAVKAIESVETPVLVNNYAAIIQFEREAAVRAEVRKDYVLREMQPYLAWQKTEFEKIEILKKDMLDVSYLHHFYGWLIVIFVSVGIFNPAVNEAFWVVCLFGGPLFTMGYHQSKIKESEKYKALESQREQIKQKVLIAQNQSQAEAEEEWGDQWFEDDRPLNNNDTRL